MGVSVVRLVSRKFSTSHSPRFHSEIYKNIFHEQNTYHPHSHTVSSIMEIVFPIFSAGTVFRRQNLTSTESDI